MIFATLHINTIIAIILYTKWLPSFCKCSMPKKNKNLLVYFPLDKKHWKHLIIGSLSKNITSN